MAGEAAELLLDRLAPTLDTLAERDHGDRQTQQRYQSHEREAGMMATIAGAISNARMVVSTRYMSAGPATMRTARSSLSCAHHIAVGYRS